MDNDTVPAFLSEGIVQMSSSEFNKLIGKLEKYNDALETISHMYPDEAEMDAAKLARETLEEKC